MQRTAITIAVLLLMFQLSSSMQITTTDAAERKIARQQRTRKKCQLQVHYHYHLIAAEAAYQAKIMESFTHVDNHKWLCCFMQSILKLCCVGLLFVFVLVLVVIVIVVRLFVVCFHTLWFHLRPFIYGCYCAALIHLRTVAFEQRLRNNWWRWAGLISFAPDTFMPLHIICIEFKIIRRNHICENRLYRSECDRINR